MKPVISESEFRQRVERTQAAMRKEGLDLLLCFGNEAEPQYIRYYSNYWPSFETAGVLIPHEGEAVLLIGPESGTFAASVSRLPAIRRLLAFRESSEPEYPGVKLDTFDTVIPEVLGGGAPKRMGLVGSCLITQAVYAELGAALGRMGAAPPEKADGLVAKLRAHKSPDEIACMREAYRITSLAMRKVLDSIAVGMTENQVKGIAMSVIFGEGAESEGYPFWILAGEGSNQAISRCRNKVIQAGDIVQVQVSARYEGYVATMGRPVVMGRATPFQSGLINAALAAQKAILETAGPGVNAGAVSGAHYDTLKALGYEDHILYGPCHGTGLMEGEFPWIESNSDYPLEEDMAFCTCVYLGNDEKRVGVRVEDGFIITAGGVESLSDYRRELIEIER